MKPAARYRRMIDAANRQGDRFQVPERSEDRWTRMAARFRMDPTRPLDPNLEAIASHIQPGDVVLDVGGGAGRVSLPLASRCREVVNVEPSPGMGEQFLASAADGGLSNARVVQSNWLDAGDLEGDVILVCNVTYFVREIVAFVQKLQASARRRVIITVWTVPPPDRNAALFEMAFATPKRPVPGYRQLLPVLWALGIVPDVKVLSDPFPPRGPFPATKRETIVQWLGELRPKDPKRAEKRLRKGFRTVFERREGGGWWPAFRPEAREVLITWETGK
jgi:SAM-dependent methyltransferase